MHVWVQVMNIPGEWSSLMREKGKKIQDTVLESESSCLGKRKMMRGDVEGVDNFSDSLTSYTKACEAILREIQSATQTSTESSALILDNLMSSAPYRNLVESLFSTDQSRCSPNIPVVCRAYEESFMRQPMHPEEAECVMGSSCECNFLDEKRAFVGVQVSHVPTLCKSISHKCATRSDSSNGTVYAAT